MLFITIILALAFELMFVHSEKIKKLGWLNGYRNLVIRLFGKSRHWDGPFGVLAILLLPILLVALFQVSSFFKESMFGIVGILSGVLILAYCLRYRPMDQAIDQLSITNEADDVAAMQEILGHKEPSGQHRFSVLTESVLVQANERLFSVLFWFMVFGPAGALAYRTSWYLAEHPLDGEIEPEDDDLDAASYRLFGILSWVPARICAAGYALAGRFEDALSEWKEPVAGSQYDFCESNNRVLGKTGMGALHIAQYTSTTSEDDLGDTLVNSEALKAARALVLRTLLLGCTLIALVTLTGWVVT